MFDIDDDRERLQLEIRQLQALRTEVLMKTQRLLQMMDALSDELDTRLNNLSGCMRPPPPPGHPQANERGARPN